MSAQNGVNEYYWAGYVQAMRKRLACYDGKENKARRLVKMLRDGLAQELAGLDASSAAGAVDALDHAAKLLAAWQQIIEEVTA